MALIASESNLGHPAMNRASALGVWLSPAEMVADFIDQLEFAKNARYFASQRAG